MAKQNINVGTAANDKKGDSLRAAFVKVNANFTELYTALGINADGTLNLGAFEFAGSVMSTTDSTAIVIDQATTITSDLTVGGDIVPSIANGGNLGSLAKPFRSLYVSNNTIFLGGTALSVNGAGNLLVNGSLITGGTTSYNDLSDKPNLAGTYQFSVAADDSTQRVISTDEVVKFVGAGGITTASDAEGRITITQGTTSSLVNGARTASLGSDGALTIPGDIKSNGNINIDINLSDSTLRRWQFGEDGNLVVPGDINLSGGTISRYSQNGLTGLKLVANADQGQNVTIMGTGNNTFPILNYVGTTLSGITIGTPEGDWNFMNGNLTIPGDIKSNGNINIDINLADSTLRRWQFGEDGNLTLPAGGNISEGGGFTGAIRLTPAGGANANQALLIYPTGFAEGDHIHLTAGGGSTELYLGDDYHYVKLASNGFVVIKADDGVSGKVWGFSPDGTTSIPGDIKSDGNINIEINLSDSTLRRWQFGEDGDLTFPNGVLKIAGNTISNYVAGDMGGSGSQLEVSQSKTVITNGVTNDLGGGGSGLTGQSLFEVSTNGILSSFQVINTLGEGEGGLTSEYLTELDNNSFKIGQRVTNDLGGGSEPLVAFSGWTFSTDSPGYTKTLTLPVNSSILTNETALNIATHSTTTYTFNQAYWEAVDGDITRVVTPTGNAQYFACTVTRNQDSTYTAAVTNAGISFVPGNWFKVPGDELGGATPANDIQITVATVNGSGTILTTTVTGTAVGKQWTFGTGGTLTFPDATVQTTAWTGIANALRSEGNINIEINLSDSTLRRWQFGEDGILTLPSTGKISNSGYDWTFGTNGALTLPNGAVIKDTAGNSVVFGEDAGTTSQGANAVAIGTQAGNSDQGTETVAIGALAGISVQGQGAVAVGFGAGYNLQGVNSVAIGKQAGLGGQGANAIAIGYRAGDNNQAANTIILNASGVIVNSVAEQPNSFYVAPIRSAAATANVVYYNTTTKEVTYGAAGSAAAGTLTGTALASGVVSSSLTSVGTLGTLNVTGAATAERFNTDQITVVGNRITTTVTNANLELECNGTGGVVVNGGKLILNTGGNAYVESVDYGVNSANSALNIFGGPFQKINLRAGFGTQATWTLATDGTLTLPGSIVGTATQAVFNTTSTTVNAFGAATTALNIGASGAPITGFAATATTSSTASSLGYLGLPQSATATTATLAIGDASKHIYVTTASQTITIPANASVAYPIGTTLTFIAGPSATTVSIAITSDTLRLAGGTSTGTRTLAANGMATAVKVAATTWYINGTGLT